jgi:hypothetical protein
VKKIIPMMIIAAACLAVRNAGAAKVCVQVQSYCSSSPTSRAGSGQFCWCGVGGIWHSSDAYDGLNSNCPTTCPGLCGA